MMYVHPAWKRNKIYDILALKLPNDFFAVFSKCTPAN